MKQDKTPITHSAKLIFAVFGLAAICAAASARAGDDAAPPRPWDCDPVAWQERDGGAFEAIGSGYALAPCPKGTEVEVSARVTPVSTDCPEYSNLGLSLFDDLDHRWNLYLSKKPDSKGGGTFCEMKNQRGGAWLDAPGGMAPAVREGNGKWEWGRAYDMAMRLVHGAVEGEVRDAATGALVFRAVVRPAVSGGAQDSEPEPPAFAARPALVSAGDLRGRAESVRFSVHGEVPEAWRAFPAYRPVGPETGVRGEATGFFHTENIDGTDWAIDPLGRGVILAGVDWCNPRGSYSDFLGYSPYGRFVTEHYPSTDAWAEETDARLRSWGFTFLPCGGDESLYYRSLAHADGADRLYFSHRLCLGSADPEWRIAEYRRSPCTALPNVFHPRFQEACDWWARQRCAPNRDDPWLVGYFIDNELAWWGDVPENKAGGAFDAVAKKPGSHPAKKALLAFLEERQGQKGLQGQKGPETVADVPASVKVEFLRLVAERYFAATTAAIRKADPNHMVLGCRFAGGPKHVHPVVMETAGKYCDVVSFNHYPWADLDRNAVFYAKIDKSRVLDVYREIHDLAGKPFILTEWGFSALDTGRPCTYGAGQRFYTQTERTQAAELFERTFLSLPFFIGHSFFRWADQPAVGKSKYFMENTNYGLVSEDGVPYRELTEMFTRVQGDAVRWHGAPPPEERAEARLPDDPTERERFFSEAAGWGSGRAEPSPVVGFRHEADGSWVLSNGLVRVSGRIGSRFMADEIAYFDGAVARARPVGRWGALLQGATDNIPWWVDVSRVTDVSFGRDDATGVVTATIRAEGRGDEAVAGGSAPGGVGFAFTHRRSLAPGSPDILAEIVSLENTGKEPFTVSYLFMRPFAVGNDFTGFRSVPNLWKGPVEGWWQFPDGSRWGVSSRDGGVVKATLWRREGETIQHPDVRCKDGEPFVLAPGETFRPRVPMGARIAFVPHA